MPTHSAAATAAEEATRTAARKTRTVPKRGRVHCRISAALFVAAFAIAAMVPQALFRGAFRPCLAFSPGALRTPGFAAGMRGNCHRHQNRRLLASVTGTVYEGGGVVVTLYTKEGCTLCDKVKDVLAKVNDEEGFAHSLKQVDITDDDQADSFDRYKYDIPVLHIGSGDSGAGAYWTKHRLTEDEAREALTEAGTGTFEERTGRPNAAAMER